MNSSHHQYLMPHEGYPHKRTWMGFPDNSKEWGEDLIYLQKDVIHLAKTISKYESVYLIVSSDKQKTIAQSLLHKSQIKSMFEIQLVIQPLNDLWLRDSGPVFVIDLQQQLQVGAVDFNFNGWGKKQECRLDSKIAKFIAEHSKVNRISTDLVLEGGGLEVDGEGTAILAESCILNNNRNPGWTKNQVEQELFRLLGIIKVIWIPGVRNQDITDGHVDFYARFVGKQKPGHVLVHFDKEDPSSYENYEILKRSTDAKGNNIIPISLHGPNYKKIRKIIYEEEESAVGYCNFYISNGAIIQASFGDKDADENARKVLQSAFPDKVIELIQVDNIIICGGGVHCSTQQEYI